MLSGAAAGDTNGVPPIVLIVQNDPDTREMYSVFFENSGLWVATARGADEAIHNVAEIRPNVILTDFTLDGALTGADLVHSVKSTPTTQHIPVFLITGHGVDDVPEATQQEADMLLVKPINLDLLLVHTRDAITRSHKLRQRGDTAINHARELTEQSTRVMRRAYDINERFERERVRQRDGEKVKETRCCPKCSGQLEWIDQGWLNAVCFDYYRPCINGCGLYCFDQSGNTVKLI
jgi:DNA-binding response OmpR family regulator